MTKALQAIAISTTRVRLDFTNHVRYNSDLLNPLNYRIEAVLSTVPDPEILAVESPDLTNPSAPSLHHVTDYVILVVSGMKEQARYVVAPNADGGFTTGSEMVLDWDMEAVGIANWTAGGGATVTKEGGERSGGGQVLKINNPGASGTATQSGTFPGGKYAYELNGWMRSDGTAIPRIGSQPIKTGLASTTWQAAGPTWFGDTGATGLVLYKLTTAGNWTEFDDISIKPLLGIVPSSPIIDYLSADVTGEAVLLVGEGTAPLLKLALATSPTTVRLTFDREMSSAGAIGVAGSYTFDLGLTVSAVLGVGEDFVDLETNEQAPGVLFTLTVTGVFTDPYGNALTSPSTTGMLGFSPAIEETQRLPQIIYNFLLDSLRAADQKDGNQLLQRYLEGPQQVWYVLVNTLYSILDIIDVENAPEYLLQYLKNIVGWTKALEGITDALDSATLRRLIATSVPFWDQRGVEEGLEGILRLTTTARCYILNWFDLRIILDETALGEDPWLLSVPGEGDPPDESTFNVRIVDDGTLNRALVRDLCRLARPSGERILITYLGFLDQFETENDKSQWTDWTGESTVTGGSIVLSDDSIDEETAVTVPGATSWEQYLVTFRFRGTGDRTLGFYRTHADYKYQIKIRSNALFISEIVGGVETEHVVEFTADWLGEDIADDVWYTVRVVAVRESETDSSPRITVYFDGEPVAEFFDSLSFENVQGSISVGHYSGGTIEVSDVEMLFLPTPSDFIDINS